jgi:glycine cleavage system transcriptional repressor
MNMIYGSYWLNDMNISVLKSGADNPGIVHKLTSVLAKNSLTIAYMKTRQEEAPFGGTELFTMEGKAVAYQPLASHFDHKKIGEELQELGDSLNCDVDFSDMTGSSL